MERGKNDAGREGRRSVGVLLLGGLHASEENSWAWSKRHEEFRRAIDELHAEEWRADLVVLVGDLTARGQHRDFAVLRRQYDLLRDHLARGGANPALFAVPGPSDVLAVPEFSSGVEIVASEWSERKDLQEEFQRHPECLWRKVINASFDPFSTWWKVVSKEQPTDLSYEGTLVPGEHSAALIVNGLRLRLLGFNSALQCLGGQQPRNLVIDDWRVDRLDEEGAPGDVALMVSHHDPRLFNTATQERLNYLMNRPDRPVALALCARNPRDEGELSRIVSTPGIATASERTWSRGDQSRGLVALTLDVGEHNARAKILGSSWDHESLRSTQPPGSEWIDVPRWGSGFAPREDSGSSWFDDVVRQARERYQGRSGAEALARATLSRRADLADFVHEHFPRVHRQYWDHIPFDAGMKILLDTEKPETVVQTLSGSLPSVVRRVLDEAGEPVSYSSFERFKSR